ncbi:MAG: hypothetical protein Q9172_003870 [Xanthocarpia lactea]
MDVIKFALIQQAAQCTLGYLMADETEQFIPSDYATALWAQRIRYAELIVVRWVQWTSYFWPSTASEFKSTKSTSPSALWQKSLGDLLETSTQAVFSANPGPAAFTSQEMMLAKIIYWLLIPLFQKNYWRQYRIHTPEELKQRNRVTVGEVLRSILLQQAVQTALGLCLGYLTDAGDFQGRDDYDIAVWAGRVHRARDATPWILASLGIDGQTLASRIQTYATSMGSTVTTEKPLVLLNSIVYPHLGDGLTYGFAPWELWVAKTIYWVLEPAARFGIAIFFSDSWQYFWHRAMHSNKWMFRNIHAHHHKMYVPYAFGAFYNTLTEAFILDTVGTTLSLMLSGLTIRQTMFFSTISVMKGVDDHCGYRLPWDPLQWGNEQNTAFHDVHHQSWGIKSNYSQLYTTFWDHICNTVCDKSDTEIEQLYEKGRVLAMQKAEVEKVM